MSPRLLTRLLFVVLACALIGATAGDVLAQTQQLNKTLERRFPSSFCPLPTVVLGTFVTDTGHIKLTFVTQNGYEGDLGFVHHQQKLDNVSIIESSWFNSEAVLNDNFCYSDAEWGIVGTMAPEDLIGRPEVPYYDTFQPSPGPCAWDETDGATVTGGVIELGSFGLGLTDVSTSVVISGLTPGVPYVIHGDWSADEFNILLNCTGNAICMQVTVDDLPSGCGPLPVRSTTWGAVKSLYTK